MRRLIAACCTATLALASSAGVSPAHTTRPHPRHHAKRAHARLAHRARHGRRHRTTTTTVSTTSAPVTSSPITPIAPITTTAPAAPVTTTTTSAPTTTTQSPTTPADNGQVLFDPAYPSSGLSNTVASTGWTTAQIPSDNGVKQPDRIQFTTPPGSSSDPNLPATDVLRFQLDPYYTSPDVAGGDVTDTGGYLANRAEIYGRYAGPGVPAANWPDPVGSIRWYSLSVYLPAGFPTATSYENWFDFTQWKGLNSGSPPVAMSIVGNQFVLGGANSDTTLGPITPGSWTHFIVGMDFSDSATTGWATVYLDGNLVVDQQATKTMNDATVNGITGVDPNYLKMGIYRSKTWKTTQVIYLTPMVIGTTYDSVASTPPPAG